MQIEDKVFARQRFIKQLLIDFGFKKVKDNFHLMVPFLNDNFEARLTIDKKGKLTGVVWDLMNDEEYIPLRQRSFQGAYVNQVRSEYENLLKKIAKSCCNEVLFASEQANRLTHLIFEKYYIHPDFPWDDQTYQSAGTFRHKETSKWFGLMMNIKYGALLKNNCENSIDVLNLKVKPVDGEQSIKKQGIFPGYHMNHRHWISIVLDETHSDEDIMALIENSFQLTKGSKK